CSYAGAKPGQDSGSVAGMTGVSPGPCPVTPDLIRRLEAFSYAGAKPGQDSGSGAGMTGVGPGDLSRHAGLDPVSGNLLIYRGKARPRFRLGGRNDRRRSWSLNHVTPDLIRRLLFVLGRQDYQNVSTLSANE